MNLSLATFLSKDLNILNFFFSILFSKNIAFSAFKSILVFLYVNNLPLLTRSKPKVKIRPKCGRWPKYGLLRNLFCLSKTKDSLKNTWEEVDRSIPINELTTHMPTGNGYIQCAVNESVSDARQGNGDD